MNQENGRLRSTLTTNLVLIGGAAGCGKSNVGAALAHTLGYALYDKDTLTLPLVEECLKASGNSLGVHDRESPFYLLHVRPAEYRCLMDAVLASIALGISAIGVAPFLKEFADLEWRKDIEERCSALSAARCRVHFVWLHAEHEVVRQRLLNRGAGRDASKLQRWNEYLAAVSAIRPLDPCCRIDSTSQNAEQLATHLAEAISR